MDPTTYPRKAARKTNEIHGDFLMFFRHKACVILDIKRLLRKIPFLFVFDIKAKDLRNQVNGKDQEENPKRITDGVSHANAGLCLRDKDFNIFLGKDWVPSSVSGAGADS